MGILDTLAKAAGDAVNAYREASGDTADSDEIGPDQMADLMRRAGLAEPTEEKPRALFHDPYSVMDWGGWREKPNALTYDTLRAMSQKNTAISAIIQTRVNQVAAFGKPQQGRYDRGFRVVLRDRRDLKRSMSRQEAMQAALIERMLETTGILLPDERPSDRDSFRQFLKKAVRDILIYDQWCWEKIRDRRGQISRFIALPSETIRPAVADIEHIDPAQMHNRVSHVQVYEDTVIAEFSPDDLAWCVMNPRSDLRVNSFGYSPVEMITNLITAWLFGFEYNQRFFTNGANVKGVLNIKGAIPDRQLKAFRRLWYSMVSGVNNAWRTPILNSEDIQWVSMHANNREMEFAAWMDWLTKLTCAVFGMDPIEINFIFGNTGQTSGLNQSRPNEDEVTASKDKGLTPLMEFIEDELNKHIVWEINPDFEFKFTGLNAKEEKAERDGRIQEVQNYKRVNEIRAELDMEPIEGGDIILNPVFAQAAGQGQQGQDGAPEEEAKGPLDELAGDEDAEDLPDNFDEDEGDGAEDTGTEETADEEDTEPEQPTFKSMDLALGRVSSLLGEPLRKSKRSVRTAGGNLVFDILMEDE